MVDLIFALIDHILPITPMPYPNGSEENLGN